MSTRKEAAENNENHMVLKGATMEPKPRAGEERTPIPFRSSRFFCVGNRWYFTTREGFDSGPYATRERAEVGLRRFLSVVRMLPEQQAETRH